MWFAKGSHNTFPIHNRFVRAPEGGTKFIDIGPFDKEAWENVEFTAVPCEAGI